MAACERPLDPLLAGKKPVERRVGLVLVGPLDPDLARERRLGEGARHRQLRARADQTLDDHRETQLTLPRARPVEQPRKLEPPRHRKRRLDMACRQRTLDLERLAGGDQALAAQRRPDQLDQLVRQMGEIRQRLLLDLAALAVGAPQQVRGVDTIATPGRVRDHVHRTRMTRPPRHKAHATAPTGQHVVTTPNKPQQLQPQPNSGIATTSGVTTQGELRARSNKHALTPSGIQACLTHQRPGCGRHTEHPSDEGRVSWRRPG